MFHMSILNFYTLLTLAPFIIILDTLSLEVRCIEAMQKQNKKPVIRAKFSK